MNLLVVIEGKDTDSRLYRFIKRRRPAKVYLICLSPRVKAEWHAEKVRSNIGDYPEIEVVDHTKLVDFYAVRKALLDFIGIIPGAFKTRGVDIHELLNIDGLDMWWSSGIVEATPYKRNIFQNFYYLSALKKFLNKSKIGCAYFYTADAELRKDAERLFLGEGVEIYIPGRGNFLIRLKEALKSLKWKASGRYSFILHIMLSAIFRVICPSYVRPSLKSHSKMYIFYTSYPGELGFNVNGMPEAKIYKDLPERLSKEAGGEHYYLCHLFVNSIRSIPSLIRDARRMWKAHFRFMPIDMFASAGEFLNILLSRVPRRKYNLLKKSAGYKSAFIIDGIDMFYTFDRVMRDSLTGHEALINLMHYRVFHNLAASYGDRISSLVYYLEFHNWEVALISGIKGACKGMPVTGLQQSAPNPILLSFFFSPSMFADKENPYPLPDSILCSGEIYRDLFISSGIEAKRLVTVGHISGRPKGKDDLSGISKEYERSRLGLPSRARICLIASSIDVSITDAMVFAIACVAKALPEILFLFKDHPNSPVKPFLIKYGIDTLRNVKAINYPIIGLFPLVDYFLSSSTTTSQEALLFGLPQANLDVAALPNSNPLHFVEGLVKDVRSSEELLNFFENADKYVALKEKAPIFVGSPDMDAREEILNILSAKKGVS